MSKPTARQRLQAAWRTLRGDFPYPIERKAAPYLWPTWKRGNPEWHLVDLGAYIEEGYNLNSLIYSAINYKARAGSTAPLRAYKGDMEHPELLPPGHPLSNLLQRPNPNQSWEEFQSGNIASLNVAGNAYVYMDRARGGGLPVAMWPLRPDRVFIVPDDKRGIRGYMYTPEGTSAQGGIALLPENVMHVKLPNPGDPLEGMGYGLSPISALAQSADVDNKITSFLKTFFDEGTMVSFLLKFDFPLDDISVARIRERWMEIYGGSQNWSKPGVLDQGGEAQRLGMTFDEMGFDGLDERNETRILGPFGVPPILIGSRVGLQRSTYSNYEEARRAFWQDTMLWEYRLFEVEYQYYLQDEGGAFVAFDYSDVPALRRDTPAMVAAFAQLVGTGISKNEAAATVGLEFGDLPDGDVVYMPVGMVAVAGPPEQMPEKPEPPPVEEPPQEEAEPVDTEEEPEQDTEGMAEAEEQAEDQDGKKALKVAGWSPDQKAALWKAHDTIAQSWEQRFEQMAARQFQTDLRELLAILNEGKAKALEEKATVAWSEMLLRWQDYLTMAGLDNWRKAFVPLVSGVIQDQAERWTATLGMQFNIRNVLAEDWLKAYILKFAQPINQTTLDAVKGLLVTAQEEGWSVPQMQKGLEAMFEQFLGGELTEEERAWFTERLPAHRTEMIARTETIRASNSGSLRLFEDYGAKRKEWLSTQDDRTRSYEKGDAFDHVEPNGQVVDIDKPFTVSGEKLMYPGDPDGSLGNFINCRCTILPVVGD